MRSRGATTKNLTPEDIKIIEEYLTSDKTYKEVAEECGMPIGTLKYRVKKYREGVGVPDGYKIIRGTAEQD